MTKTSRQEILKVAQLAAAEAAKVITRFRKERSFTVGNKGELDLVTTADLESERVIIETIKRHFPEHHFLTEEQFPSLNQVRSETKPLWVIDPIDGTTNYVHGLAYVGISIGFYEEGASQVGVVLAPFTNEEFTAIKGEGAFLNGEKIQVSGTDTLKKSLIATGFPYARDFIPALVTRASAVLSNCSDLRRFGAASLDLCNVACGRVDAYYETVNPWDMAAGRLIACEAGATAGRLYDKVSAVGLPDDLNGESLLVATPKVYDSLKKILETNDPRM